VAPPKAPSRPTLKLPIFKMMWSAGPNCRIGPGAVVRGYNARQTESSSEGLIASPEWAGQNRGNKAQKTRPLAEGCKVRRAVVDSTVNAASYSAGTAFASVALASSALLCPEDVDASGSIAPATNPTRKRLTMVLLPLSLAEVWATHAEGSRNALLLFQKPFQLFITVMRGLAATERYEYPDDGREFDDGGYGFLPLRIPGTGAR
jgi:hypothetical protein